MAEIGRAGGRKSRRRLDAEQARKMVRIREARRAYWEFHGRCFWSNPTDLRINEQDIPWVIDQLRRHGGRSGGVLPRVRDVPIRSFVESKEIRESLEGFFQLPLRDGQ
jgi:hypothetical protein